MKIRLSVISLSFSALLGLFITPVGAQQYLDLKQDGYIYDVDVVVFARQLSQPSVDSINNKTSVKTEDVTVLSLWDGEQDLFQHPQMAAPSDHSVPIESQASPVKVLSDVILSTSMDHAIVRRLSANPTYKPIYRQKWRQVPSAFLQPRYVEVSNVNQILNEPTFNRSDYEVIKTVTDYSIDGQVAFSKQRFTHLHVKMNLFRINTEGETIIYELSQQKRIDLGQWQYFDHQQFGVLAKVTAVSLEPGE